MNSFWPRIGERNYYAVLAGFLQCLINAYKLMELLPSYLSSYSVIVPTRVNVARGPSTYPRHPPLLSWIGDLPYLCARNERSEFLPQEAGYGPSLLSFQRRDNGVFDISGLQVLGSSFRGTAHSRIIGDIIRRSFVYRWPLPPLPVLPIVSSLLPSPLNTIFQAQLHHHLNLAFYSSRGTPNIRSHKYSLKVAISLLRANSGKQSTQLTYADSDMATCYEQLSLWGKEAYLDISGKMLTSGIRLNGGVLAPNGFLGRWLIKEIDMKESDLNVAIRPDYMVFVQPGGAEVNTWKLVWLTKEPSANPIQGTPYTHHSISNFPGPELMVNPQNGKRQVVYICL